MGHRKSQPPSVATVPPHAAAEDLLVRPCLQQERRRLALLEAHFDPATTRRLASTGAGPGTRCLEVGAGRGSIARWLADRGADVLALDLEIEMLEDAGGAEVLQGDVLDVDLPAEGFDLIHTRAVLTHVPERDRALERMLGWLAPGGWIVLEELDWCGPSRSDPSWTGLIGAYMRATPTIDWRYGRELLGELSLAGLEEVDAETTMDVIRGGTPLAEFYGLCVQALRPPMRAAGTATEEQVEQELARLDDPAFRGFGLSWVAAWGRRSRV